MIAIRSHSKRNSTSRPCSPSNCSCKPAGDLVRRLESVHRGVSDLGSALVGGRTRSVDADLSAKSTVGSNSSGTDPIAERECGA